MLRSAKFTAEQSARSSTWRECFALYSFYSSADAVCFQGCRVKHYSDNMGTVRIFEVGSPVSELQSMAEAVYDATKRLDITLCVEWKSRDSVTIQDMDRGSHRPWRYHDDFGLDFVTAQEVIARGVTVDAFATYLNRLCPRYFSRGFEIESAGQDYFQQDLVEGEIYLIHPHPRMLIPALRHTLQDMQLKLL